MSVKRYVIFLSLVIARFLCSQRALRTLFLFSQFLAGWPRSRSTTATMLSLTGSGDILVRRMKTDQLKDHERRLIQTCQQIILLNDCIRGLTTRYTRARAECVRSFRYSLRVRLAVVEGVRNVFYEYARDMAEIVAELRRDLFNQHVQILTESDEEEDDYYDDDDSSMLIDEEDSDDSMTQHPVTGHMM